MSDNCKAILSIGDDFGDNSCTFRCQLPEGHEGFHKEVFRDGKCIMTWEEDSRAICGLCGERTEREIFCNNFEKDHRCPLDYKGICVECARKLSGQTEIDRPFWYCSEECRRHSEEALDRWEKEQEEQDNV